MISETRIACCYVPNFSIALHLRDKPVLRPQPVVMTDHNHPTAPVVALNHHAVRAGVIKDMTVAQAHSRCPRLVVLVRDYEKEQKVSRKVLTSLQDIGPFVEGGSLGMCFLEAAGLNRLYGGEPKLAERVIATVKGLCLPITVGIAKNKFVAQVAAEIAEPDTYTIIPDDSEKLFLSNLKVERLQLSGETAETLHALGLRTIEQVAAFSGNELARRFGEEGMILSTRSRGEDRQCLVPEPLPEDLAERAVLDFSAQSAAAVAAYAELLLKRLFDRLGRRLQGCARVRVDLRCEDGGNHSLLVAVERPTLSVPVFVRQLRAQVERLRLDSGVSEMIVTIPETAALVSEQLTFDKATVAIRRIDCDRQAIEERLKNEKLYIPRLHGTFLPEDTFHFASVSSTVKSPAAVGIDEKAGWHHPYALHLIVGLRLFQPPREVAVVINDRREPDFLVLGRKSSQKVRRHFGPWELSGGWWSTDYERLYYEVETSRERMYLVYYDRLQSRWFIQGVFD